jgi:hypothetical protein
MRFLFCRHVDGVPVAQLVTPDHLRAHGAYYATRTDGLLVATERTLDGGAIPLGERLSGAIMTRNYFAIYGIPLLTR